MFPTGTSFKIGGYNHKTGIWDDDKFLGGESELTDPAKAVQEFIATIQTRDTLANLIGYSAFVPVNQADKPRKEPPSIVLTLLVCAPDSPNRPMTREEFLALRSPTELAYEFAYITPAFQFVPCNEMIEGCSDEKPVPAASLSAILQSDQYSGLLLPTTNSGLSKISGHPSPITILVHDKRAGLVTPISLKQLAALRDSGREAA